MKFSVYIFLAFLLASVYSCSDDTCNEETESLLSLELIVKDASLTAIKFVDSCSVYSSEWTDSIHYSEDGSSNILNLMLSPNSDTSEIVITSKDAPLKDTLIVVAQRELVFVSKECGFTTDFVIDTVLYSVNYIDSLNITKKNITRFSNGKIQIYF